MCYFMLYRITFEPESGKCTLLIVEVFPQDAGEYRCVAENERGKAVSVATLEVECKSSISTCTVTLTVYHMPYNDFNCLPHAVQ